MNVSVLSHLGRSVNPVVEIPAMPLLARLRAETQDAHQAIEQTLDLMRADLTLAHYRHRIEQFYGFYQPLEERLRACPGVAEWLDLQERLKTPWLEADLQALGAEALGALPLSSHLPPLDSPAQCLGCLYVLEGASLGGVIISRHIREKLAITPQSGGKFFNGYGDRTGEQWHGFRAALTAFDAATGEPDQVITAARATFETLRHWCERESLA